MLNTEHSSRQATMQVPDDRVKKMFLDRIQGLQEKYAKEMNSELEELLEGFLNDLRVATPAEDSETEKKETNPPRNKEAKNGLKDKEFVARNSLLTDLFEIKHFQAIHHIFIASLILLFFHTVLQDVAKTGKVNLDFHLMKWAFGKFHIALSIWLMMFLSTTWIAFPAFHFWANHHAYHSSRSWNFIWLIGYILYVCAMFYLPVHQLLDNQLPPASSFFVLTEQIRLIMKIHAFVRSNTSKAVQKREKNDNKMIESACPHFSKFLYFLFAPTLVYRDDYPRTKTIRWMYVTSNFGQVFGCVFYVNFMFERFLLPVFKKYGHESISPMDLTLSVFGCALPGVLTFLCGFFGLLHSWFNAFAEMLRFADRKFYLDWWNSTSFSGYYRTWNIVVHDWLYTYIYKEIYRINPSNRLTGLFVVFALSAIVHEYVISIALRFLYPILFILFGGFGVAFVFLTEKRKGRFWNVFIWLSLLIGTGFLLSLYAIEWYARANCPPFDDTYLDFVIPRSWSCYSSVFPGISQQKTR